MTASGPASSRIPLGCWLSAFCLGLLLFAASVMGGAWAVRRAFLAGPDSDAILSDRQKSAVLALAEFPATVRTAINQFLGRQKTPLLMLRADKEQAYWQRRFPNPEDKGYLLFSGVYRGELASSVKLIRIADGQIMASWAPDWPSIYSRITAKKFDHPVDLTNIQANDPVLLDDGDIIFAESNAAVRLSPCSRQPRWVLDEIVHHSNDLDVDGLSYWSPGMTAGSFPRNPKLHAWVKDDAIARISLTDGRLLERRSFAGILHDNGLDFLLFTGNEVDDLNTNPMHMNQIRVARIDSRYWKRGDLLISLRNPNTLLLYRPSTNRVIWHQTGPWLHQHSVDFVNDHQISVLNNNGVLQKPEASAFLTPQSINEVMVFDFDTQQITQPFKALLDEARPRTIMEGRARILPDGGLFLEETNNGRILRFARDSLMWSFVNDHDDSHIGALAWSSYLTADEVRKPLAALAARRCGSAPPHVEGGIDSSR